MAVEFTNLSPAWKAEGVEPTDEFKTTGFEAGYKPPASYFNWFWRRTSDCITELQNAMKALPEPESYATADGGVDFDSRYTASTAANGSIVSGNMCYASAENSIAIGYDCATAADCDHSIAVGSTCYITNGAANSGAFGSGVAVSGGDCGFGFGYGLTVNGYNCVVGKRNKTPTVASPTTNTGDLFVIGSGINGGAKSNALRVTAAGEVMGTQAYTASGADYAELFEWEDGNSESEDRRGLFVTLEGEKIRLANADDDYIVGVVSATPSIIGDACTDDWHGKYVTDVFGARVLENDAFKLSEDFDEEQDEAYTSRLKRPEWAAVGLVGKLIVVDDGSCQVNGYCYPSKNGIATASDTGYRVMARIDDSHVKVLLK